ncbi:MAG: hypothetical protein ACKVHP_05465 [Verrucomicrobiales bacterium]|jgi:hypothetical protein
MNYLPNFRLPRERKDFEIHLTEDSVRIVSKFPGSDEIVQVVSFRGQGEASQSYRHDRRGPLPSSTPRW